MKLQHLRFFTAVVECGGVIKASERLHISQPAVSAGIKALEEELGGALFDRGISRRLSLTPAGRRFYRQALEILNQCDAAKSDFSGSRDERTLVRIGVLDTLCQSTITALLALLVKKHPDWELSLWEGSVQRLTTWLGQGRIDLALSNVEHSGEGARVLWSEPLVAVASPQHPFAARSGNTIAIEDLAAEPFLHRSRCELDSLGRAQLKAAGISLRVKVRGERDELIFELVRRGNGITLAPRSLVPSDLLAINVAGLSVNRSIGLLWHRGTEQDVIDLVAEELLELNCCVS